ncbi:MAG TPA: 30S ribosomal protein S6 [Candidatus Hydrothermia bacterium]|nr:30S ribosomal protein S6 [Candidatus Hydrothermae bacterium]MDD3648725.1 30S ribosomal protein S6 [Candidatus Hydrothermia bacterium]MDD5573253.1 30S ribosomal protein S6 [Candidatus Hydrothermia bacterium]HOK22415.1 30S ribosomal protein S6 [Candidatus Hydrothermia bacterium]HOL23122.1 30S ribosomal protein S6 [Candidatus Hydrothermia bacterium]
MRNYEMMVIIDPTLQDEERDGLIEKLKSIIEKNGKVTSMEVWGKREMAYEINKNKEGFYVLFNFEAEPQSISKLKQEVRMNKSYLRELIVRK